MLKKQATLYKEYFDLRVVNDNVNIFIDLSLPKNKTYTLAIDYPTNKEYIFQIKTGVKGLTEKALIDKIRKTYEKVYNAPQTYGVWGHDISDLWIESIAVDHKKKTIDLGMGS